MYNRCYSTGKTYTKQLIKLCVCCVIPEQRHKEIPLTREMESRDLPLGEIPQSLVTYRMCASKSRLATLHVSGYTYLENKCF